jgi:hypothetical protein
MKIFPHQCAHRRTKVNLDGFAFVCQDCGLEIPLRLLKDSKEDAIRIAEREYYIKELEA